MAETVVPRSGERVLPAGATRRRIFFGLFDADGWAWASVKAFFWFLVAWVTLGYLPDRAYYFTVLQTIDVNGFVGFERVFGLQQPPFFPVVNFCPPTNGSIDCPSPPGGMTNWQVSPPQLALPEGRTEATVLQAGTRLFVAGGLDPSGKPTSTVFVTSRLDLPLEQTGGQPIETGNLVRWTPGTALPAPRAAMASTSFQGTLYLFGGAGPDGKPTNTVWVGTIDPDSGEISKWDAPAEMALPAVRFGAVAVSLPTGILVLGGDDGKGPTNSVFFNQFDARKGAFTKWVSEPAGLTLPASREYATAYAPPGFVFVVGGQGPDGKPTSSVFRLSLTVCPGDPNGSCQERDLPGQWATGLSAAQLPAPRAGAASLFANGTMYVIGGRDANGPVRTVYWALPETQNQFSKGDLRGGWQHHEQTDLRLARSAAAVAAIGSYVFVVGGSGGQGAGTSLERASLAPAPPFFRLGIVGLTLPGLQIRGALGQELGWIAAGGVFVADLTVLVIIGWALNHRPQAWALISRFTRGRIRNRYAGRRAAR